MRSARSAARYLATVQTWNDPQFATFTVPNVKASQLRSTLREMIAAATAIARAVRRTDGLAWQAIRKLEVTAEEYSASVSGAKRAGYYHPHFHFLVNGYAPAVAFQQRWCEQFRDAALSGQNIRPLDRHQGAARELFKYATKLVSKLDGRHTAIPFGDQDVIYQALKGLRTWQPMGIRATAVTAPDDEDSALALDGSTLAELRADETIRWEWSTGTAAWFDIWTGEVLGEPLPEPLSALITNVRQDASSLPPRSSGIGPRNCWDAIVPVRSP